MQEALELNARLSGALEVGVTPRKGVEQICEDRFREVRTTGRQEGMDAIHHVPAVKFMRSHHGVQHPHGALEDTAVLVALFLPLPVMNTSSEGFLHHQLNISKGRVGHQGLNMGSVLKQPTLRKKLRNEQRLAEVALRNVCDVAQQAAYGRVPFCSKHGFKSLFNHGPGGRWKADVDRPASQGFDDARRRVGGENKTGASAALFHHPSQVGLSSMAEVIGVLDHDDPGHRRHPFAAGTTLLSGWSGAVVRCHHEAVVERIETGTACQRVVG